MRASNDQGPSGLVVAFDRVDQLYALASTEARWAGDSLREDVASKRWEMLWERGWLSVAQGQADPSDGVVQRIYVELMSGYSPDSGEWIGLQAFIVLADEPAPARFLATLNDLRRKLQADTGMLWHDVDSTALAAAERDMMVVFAAGEEPDEPAGLTIAADDVPLEQEGFIERVREFGAMTATVVNHLYESRGYQPRDLRLEVLGCE